MNEKELPIRHQRDPKLSPIRFGYKRERALSDPSWIPTRETDTTDVFPWILGEATNGKYPAPVINPEFTTQADEAKTVSVYGEWKGRESLSSEGRQIVNDIIFVFENLTKELVKTEGKMPETLLFAGYPLEQYRQMIDDTIKDKREHRYIMEQFTEQSDLALERFAETWRKTATTQLVPTKEEPPYVHPSKRFNQSVLSATTAINLVYDTPFDQVKPPQEEPKPSVPETTPPGSPIIAAASHIPEKVVWRSVHTDITKAELIAEGLIDAGNELKPIVLMAMGEIRDVVRDPSSKVDPYQMVNRMRHDPGVNNKDIDTLNSFTKHLLKK